MMSAVTESARPGAAFRAEQLERGNVSMALLHTHSAPPSPNTLLSPHSLALSRGCPSVNTFVYQAFNSSELVTLRAWRPNTSTSTSGSRADAVLSYPASAEQDARHDPTRGTGWTKLKLDKTEPQLTAGLIGYWQTAPTLTNYFQRQKRR